jgi:DNA invertase Pin-like site-specific DNA recombinase
MRKIRCAIYCRKSSEEGLTQQFNSLDAQYEACLSYIQSQRHEGWIAVDHRFDDGGFSGGTLDRPALQRLLRDIEAGKIDTVVCYKIDRLSRSLADFVRLVEVLERHGTTFVSVTQSFCTTSSMGRLTLNVLLSFAQFEREVAAERIRDKFAASRRKGMWMGGHAPLGYVVRDRKLVVSDTEAALVRHVFERFLQVGSATMLVQELNAAGYRTKRGKPFDKGVLYKLINNRTYVGEVSHRGAVYAGEHEALVDRATWDKVHAILAQNGHRRTSSTRAATPALLKGLIFGPDDRAMAPSHTRRRGRLYRFYRTATSLKLCHGDCPIRAVPAGEVEAVVINQGAPCCGRRRWSFARGAPPGWTTSRSTSVKWSRPCSGSIPYGISSFLRSMRASCSCWSRAWRSGWTASRSACGSRVSAVWWRSFGYARLRSGRRHDRRQPEPRRQHHHGVRPHGVAAARRAEGCRGATRF